MINPMDLRERSILVTGASSGIGRETAVLLSELNARLILTGRNQERLDKTLGMLQGAGHRICPFDVDRLDEIPGWLKRIAVEDGPLAGLVHCAGVEVSAPVAVLSAQRVESVMRTNVGSALMLARAFRQKGCWAPDSSLVFVSSIRGVVGAAALSVYGASKAALIGMVKALAIEFAPDRIRVNCVVPGFVQTEMTDRLRARLTSEQFTAIAAMHPLGIGTPRDVANGIAFLLADTGAWITGSSLVIDGGYTAH